MIKSLMKSALRRCFPKGRSVMALSTEAMARGSRAASARRSRTGRCETLAFAIRSCSTSQSQPTKIALGQHMEPSQSSTSVLNSVRSVKFIPIHLFRNVK